ncbi:MAG: PIG-L family deacetylase [Actinomycetota bacterium]|nr:PIG-L family deacetylase [Actinomycetota bacterium]
MATIVFLHAHPDDESLASGGTMALLSDAGHRVILVVATRGEEGEPVPGVLAPGEALEDRRTDEVQEAARIIGVARVAFLGYRDSGMADDPANAHPDCFWQADVDEAVARLDEALADDDPDLLVAYDPNGGYGHPDHIQVHRVGTRWAGQRRSCDSPVRLRWVTLNRDVIQATMDAALAAAEEAEVNGEPIWSDDAMLQARRERLESGTYGMPDADITHGVDVRSVLDRKRAAMRAHASQIPEDSFFLAMPDEAFALAFGREWYVDPDRLRDGRPQVDDPLLP